MSNEPKRKRRARYQKPKLRVIDLAAEEVLGIGCKTSSANGGGPLGATRTANNCLQIGS